jgi:Zn-dependent protease with chaperone function
MPERQLVERLETPRRRPSWLSAVPEPGSAFSERATERRHRSARQGSRFEIAASRARFGTVVALVVTWSGLCVSLLAAAVGFVLGALVASGALMPTRFTLSSFDTGPPEGASLWHVLVGAAEGAGGSFIEATRWLFGTPWGLAAGPVGGLLVAAGVMVAWTRAEDRVLRALGRRRLATSETRRIAPLLQRIGTGVSDEDAPRLVMVDSDVPFARPRLRHIELSTGLLEELDDEQLTALLAHELSHWRSGDAFSYTLLFACSWPIALFYGAGVRVSGRSAERRFSLSAVVWVVLFPAWVLTRYVIAPAVSKAFSEMEYDADEKVRQLGLGADLARVLQTFPHAECADSPWARALRGSCPPRALRIERLEARRPLDLFFGERERDKDASNARVSTLAVAAVTAALVAGAFSSVHDMSSTRQRAVETAASFTVAYLDNALDRDAYAGVIARYVPAQSVAEILREADSAPLGVDALLIAGEAGPSRAEAVGCRYVTSDAGTIVADVAVAVRWRYALSGVTRSQRLRTDVALRLAGGRLVPAGIPRPAPTGTDAAPTKSNSALGPC